jgi:hypothetical protein
VVDQVNILTRASVESVARAAAEAAAGDRGTARDAGDQPRQHG